MACELESVQIESELIDSSSDSIHEHDEHDEHDEESHTNVSANYIFKCDEKKLESIEYLIFDQFTSLEEIEVQYIADENQALFQASPSNRIQKLN